MSPSSEAYFCTPALVMKFCSVQVNPERRQENDAHQHSRYQCNKLPHFEVSARWFKSLFVRHSQNLKLSIAEVKRIKFNKTRLTANLKNAGMALRLYLIMNLMRKYTMI